MCEAYLYRGPPLFLFLWACHRRSMVTISLKPVIR